MLQKYKIRDYIQSELTALGMLLSYIRQHKELQMPILKYLQRETIQLKSVLKTTQIQPAHYINLQFLMEKIKSYGKANGQLLSQKHP